MSKFQNENSNLIRLKYLNELYQSILSLQVESAKRANPTGAEEVQGEADQANLLNQERKVFRSLRRKLLEEIKLLSQEI